MYVSYDYLAVGPCTLRWISGWIFSLFSPLWLTLVTYNTHISDMIWGQDCGNCIVGTGKEFTKQCHSSWTWKFLFESFSEDWIGKPRHVATPLKFSTCQSVSLHFLLYVAGLVYFELLPFLTVVLYITRRPSLTLSSLNFLNPKACCVPAAATPGFSRAG